MSAKRIRTFWPFSPCPEVHCETSREDAVLKAVRVRFAHLSIDEIHTDLTGIGFNSEEIYNAIKAVELLPDLEDES